MRTRHSQVWLRRRFVVDNEGEKSQNGRGIRLNQVLRLGAGWYNDTRECSQESSEPREWEAKMAGVTQESVGRKAKLWGYSGWGGGWDMTARMTLLRVL